MPHHHACTVPNAAAATRMQSSATDGANASALQMPQQQQVRTTYCSSGSAPSSVTRGGASLRCSVVTMPSSWMNCGQTDGRRAGYKDGVQTKSGFKRTAVFYLPLVTHTMLRGPTLGLPPQAAQLPHACMFFRMTLMADSTTAELACCKERHRQ